MTLYTEMQKKFDQGKIDIALVASCKKHPSRFVRLLAQLLEQKLTHVENLQRMMEAAEFGHGHLRTCCNTATKFGMDITHSDLIGKSFVVTIKDGKIISAAQIENNQRNYPNET